MTNAQLMQEGINLMIAGMGFVMLFLWILIIAVGLMSKIINKFFPEPVTITADSPTIHSQTNDAQLRAVIAVAIAHHRRCKGLK
ncbi:oxaloacetate decarboxylase subunit gamma [Seminibacterium arietis]|uniref:Probable oxaloacetate decarboxylase gamma chain n=1 Tax=Seminibacterium arietis TaxID=1173502 RepID=A0ABW3I9L9_9PAST